MYIKQESIEFVLSKINSFHDNIKFTYETEKDGKIPFLDVLIIRKSSEIETTVFRKSTNNDIYLHWQSFSPTTWKRGTLQTLVSRAYDICSNKKHLTNEINHLKKVFNEINGYPKWVIEQIIEKVNNQNEQEGIDLETTTTLEEKQHLLMLPYKGKVGETTMKSLRNSLKKIIPANNTCKIIYKGTKLGSKFNVKDKINKKHKHDLVYKATCPNENCNETYVGEVGRRFAERIIDHHGRDKRSHLLEHAKNTGHENVNIDDFTL